MIKNFFYFISPGKFSICDIGYCAKSNNTFDINLFDIGNNEVLLKLFNLHFIKSSNYTYEKRAEWFCGYLSAFKSHEKSNQQYEKSITNPVVRILVEDINLFDLVKSLLKVNTDFNV